MRLYGIAILLLASAPLSLAQLLPQKQAEAPATDRAMVFKVDYEQGMAAPDSSSNRIDPSIKGSREKGDYLKNALIWNGLCITGAALSTAFGGHGPIWCDPNSPARF
ncbi:hypothetical protein [Fibrobacter sp. UBA3629]|uniref:hypothetical protein n=1 Tax=Fibrobacter sp. UBA3629 TaxID=1946530 RepID=UPI0025BEE9E2|nr:hypothetical protein [Fibrobacter sp. UBA3629]